MTAPWVDYLIERPEAPIEEIMAVVRTHGTEACVGALFEEGARVQYSNHERMSACVRLIDRIQHQAAEIAAKAPPPRPPKAPPRTFVTLMLKWHGPDRLTSRKIIQVDSAISELEHDAQVRRVQQIAFDLKPNPAWRLTSYDFDGQAAVDLEAEALTEVSAQEVGS